MSELVAVASIEENLTNYKVDILLKENVPKIEIGT